MSSPVLPAFFAVRWLVLQMLVYPPPDPKRFFGDCKSAGLIGTFFHVLPMPEKRPDKTADVLASIFFSSLPPGPAQLKVRKRETVIITTIENHWLRFI
jgi:hypothetical protein